MIREKMNDEYSKCENKGRQAYQENDILISGYTAYNFTTDPYEKYDVIYPSIDRVDEIKYRDISAGKYIDKGFMMEKTKYDELIKHNQAYYICFFHNCFIMWDIRNMPQPEFITMNCTHTTATNYGERVPKQVVLLEYDNAFMVVYKKIVLNEKKRQDFKPFLRAEYAMELEKEEQMQQDLIKELFQKIKEEKK